jgi:hypothetical protein
VYFQGRARPAMARSKVCKRHVHHVSARQTAQFGLQVPLYFQEAGLPWTSKQTDPLAPACAIRLRRPFSLFLSSLANSVPSANALCLFVLFFFALLPRSATRTQSCLFPDASHSLQEYTASQHHQPAPAWPRPGIPNLPHRNR